MENTNYTSRELAEEIISQYDNCEGADIETISTDDVQRWLDATDNEGDAKSIVSEIEWVLAEQRRIGHRQ